jgi:hypothetical protein
VLDIPLQALYNAACLNKILKEETIMQVRCVDNQGVEKEISVGVVYEVCNVLNKEYRIDKNDRGQTLGYYKWRFEEVQEKALPIDTHYNFMYNLTEADKQAGTIKIDPYFVSQQWNIGSKDPSGVIWHIFKTCARFGEKNDKQREIAAIYKSIKRLAELEGISLES